MTLPTIFNPFAITVPRCFDANIVTSYAIKNTPKHRATLGVLGYFSVGRGPKPTRVESRYSREPSDDVVLAIGVPRPFFGPGVLPHAGIRVMITSTLAS